MWTLASLLTIFDPVQCKSFRLKFRQVDKLIKMSFVFVADVGANKLFILASLV
jgi:hypothetical protein